MESWKELIILSVVGGEKEMQTKKINIMNNNQKMPPKIFSDRNCGVSPFRRDAERTTAISTRTESIHVALGKGNRSQQNKCKRCNSVIYNAKDDDSLWKMSYGEYLLDAMMEQLIYPRHIAEETGLEIDYIDKILEDEIYPWDLSVNLVRYFDDRLNLNSSTTRRIITQHLISPDILEKLNYSEIDYESILLMPQEKRRENFLEFLRYEEKRKRNFLSSI